MASGIIQRASTRSIAAYLAFFLSGASSLIFQTIWTRMLHHVFGATSVAISTVLTVFMAGLGLGAWLGGKYASRIKHPIITYAIAEIGVGVWGLLVPLLVRSDGWLATVNMFLRAELGAESGLFMVARFLCVAPILFVPTTLMGSTLPLLTRHFVASNHAAEEASSKVGALYALNTLGASTGPLLSAFVLLPGFGLSVTNIVACSMNFSLAAIIFLARRSLLAGTWNPGEKLSFLPAKGPVEPPEAEAKASDAKPAEVMTEADPVDEEAPVEEAPVEEAPVEEAPEEETPKAKRKPKRPGKTKKAKAEAAAKVASKPASKTGRPKKAKKKPRRPEVSRPEPDGDPPIPELARKAAYLCFAASGAAALCYEVVWSRALAMTIGSSIYSFALILETFLVGIAVGSAAMSAFLGRRNTPFLGMGLTAIVLILLANVPWAVDMVNPTDVSERFEGSILSFVVVSLLYAAPVVLAVVWISLRMAKPTAADAVFRGGVDGWRPLITVIIAAVPTAAALINLGKYPGILPQIILAVVASVSLFLVLASLLSKTPVLLVAVIQLFIAGATLVSYIYQDDVPYAFAQLVVSIPEGSLPDHVGTVKVFMFLTIVLCTLPSTLGMGAMFPLVVRVWTSGGDSIAKDVASVYTGNTVGSIIGSWLPGFILFALIGAERTLHLGVALNMMLALLMLIAGAADPGEDQSWWSWRRVNVIALPLAAAVALGVSIATDTTRDTAWMVRAGGSVAFLALAGLAYRWLRTVDSDEAPSIEVAAGAAVLPMAIGLGIAYFVHAPGEHPEWAVSAVYVALKATVAAVGIGVGWLTWAAWYDVHGAAPMREASHG